MERSRSRDGDTVSRDDENSRGEFSNHSTGRSSGLRGGFGRLTRCRATTEYRWNRARGGGVETDERGFVETDDSFETTADDVYAIGDVSESPMFTHSARDDADLLYRRLVKDEEIGTEGRTVPWAVFTDPQVGHVGLTEQDARNEGYEVGVDRQDFADQGKPKALGETEGFVKPVTDAETDESLGAHVVGKQGAEIVHGLVLTVELGATADDIANTMHIHPTLPESIDSAAGGVNKPSRQALSRSSSSPGLAEHVVQVPRLPEFEERSVKEFPNDELLVVLCFAVLTRLHLLGDRPNVVPVRLVEGFK